MTTLRETINAAITQAEQDKAAAVAQADAKIASLQAQLQQQEGAFVALLDTEVERLKSFFGSIGQHLGL